MIGVTARVGPWQRRRAACALLACLAATMALDARAATGLIPHRAAYSITQGHTDRESNIGAIRGRLELDFERSCDGWRFQQHIGLQIVDTDGQAREHLSSLDGWETHRPAQYWFTLRGYMDCEEVEHFSGSARADAHESAARFSAPAPATVPLDPATLFPVAHIEALIEAARSRRRQHVARVFDGTVAGAGFEVSAVIGAAIDNPDPSLPVLAGLRGWPIRLAFFTVGASSAEASFEMGLTLLENGVAAALEYDYGDFSMDLALESIEIGIEPVC